jgi:hypothetical protein
MAAYGVLLGVLAQGVIWVIKRGMSYLGIGTGIEVSYSLVILTGFFFAVLFECEVRRIRRGDRRIAPALQFCLMAMPCVFLALPVYWVIGMGMSYLGMGTGVELLLPSVIFSGALLCELEASQIRWGERSMLEEFEADIEGERSPDHEGGGLT